MMDFRKISFDIRTGIVFGIAALVLSFLTGVVSGVGLKSILWRTVILVMVFSGIGFAVVFVLKRYVPEFYEFLTAAFSGQDAGLEQAGSAGAAAGSRRDMSPDDRPRGPEGSVSGEEPTGPPEEKGEFSELTEKSFPRYETISDTDLEPTANISQGKMGKHIIEKEKVARYEPKLMAEAIRTMMSRDQE